MKPETKPTELTLEETLIFIQEVMSLTKALRDSRAVYRQLPKLESPEDWKYWKENVLTLLAQSN